MRSAALAIFLALGALAPIAAGAGEPRIAIIIDDLGDRLDWAEEALALRGALTYSVLPHRPFSTELANMAHQSGREVMLHQPMQSTLDHPMGSGGLWLGMDRATFQLTLSANLDAVPHVSGMNNHMGSLLTSDHQAMAWLMEVLRSEDLYFVDSRTDGTTVAEQSACEAGLPNSRRDVFLDNDPDHDRIEAQFDRLLQIAHERGHAIAIGHPYPATVAVLQRRLPLLNEAGVSLVPVSSLIQQRSGRLWPVCSSPSPKVAKNSRR